MCALAVYSSGATPAQSFQIDNVSVRGGNSAVIQPDARLTVQKAQEPDVPPVPEKGVIIRSFDAARSTATIYSDVPRTATVIFAGARGEQLTAVKVVEVQLQAGDNTVFADGFKLDDGVAGTIMVWDDLISLKPLCKAYPF